MLSKIVQESVEKSKETLERNAWGLVCECGGGGHDYDKQEKCEKCNGCGIYRWEFYKLKEYQVSFAISLLEAELLRLEKQSAEIKIDWKDLSSPELIAEKSEKYGYNTALQDQITYLQEQIEIIKKTNL